MIEIPKGQPQNIQENIQLPPVIVGNTINDIISIFSPSTTSVIQAFGIAATSLFDLAVSKYIQYGREAIIENGIVQNSPSLLPGYQHSEIDNPKINNSVDNIVNGSNKIYAPDAYPNGKGGYSQFGSLWNGRLSSSTNLPVMSSLTFVGTSYISLSGQVITIPTITFEMVMISMTKGRNIEKTEITGRDTGSVKEYISSKDWSIDIRAIVVASQNVVSEGMQNYYQNGKYPEENMEQIDLLLSAPIAIKVICPYIQKRVNNGGDVWLVIEDGVQINQVDSEYEIQRLVIPCITDFPLVVKVGV